jgi:predicted aldo/keto reductase-like oxidoreductase
MEYRPLGITGEKLSVIGFGGVVVMDETPKTSSQYVAQAIDRGINYFDVAPAYGNAQQRLGPALKPYRHKVFLACKTEQRTAKKAMADLRNSLKVLRTDHIDLYQMHAVNTKEDLRQVTGPGGALEAFCQAREKGLVRYLGFSSHNDTIALKLLDCFNFDSVLFPVNCVSWYNKNVGPAVVKKALAKNTAILALKALAKRKWKAKEDHRGFKSWYKPVDTFADAALSLRFTLSQPVTAAVSPGDADLLWLACEIADHFTPITKHDITVIKKYVRNLSSLFPQ